MLNVDFIIVGQGLAGSVLARRLKQANQSVLVIDKNEEMTSSKVAGGLVNPITGRRFVMSWLFPLLNKEARTFYQEWEQEIGLTLLYEMPIVRAMEDRRFIDDVEVKTADSNYRDFIQSFHMHDNSYIKSTEISYKILQSYRIDLQLLLQRTKAQLIEENQYLNADFDFRKLHLEEKKIAYDGINASRIIFCEGAAGQNNPYFNYLPFQTTKGELFELIEESPLDFAYKHDLILMPIGENKIWCGSLNFWNYIDSGPSDVGEEILLQKLRKIYKPSPFIHKHLAAIRPTIKDRRPLLGVHPEHSRLVIFNGLGTKGTLLAPYFSQELVNHLMDGKNIMPEASIRRFDRLFDVAT
jgi:glycine/D-amino acid oxidase-like deaminating enzyme